MTLHERLAEASAAVRARAPGAQPRVGLVLGSGLAALADLCTGGVSIPFGDLPHLGRPSVQGHPGRLVLGSLAGVPVALLQGRLHAYEGVSPAEVAFPVRLLCWLGIRALVLTNASGAIRAGLQVGDLLLITDHLNLSGQNPLTGPNDEAVGPRFPDLSLAYTPRLRAALQATAQRLGIPLQEGVYAMMAGPSYETPAEIRMLRGMGADCVGMSTVPEVIAAAHQGTPVVAISCIANPAAGLGTGQPLSHQDVQLAVGGAAATLGRLLTAFVPSAASM
jgi:purine-nucleoside phosphorylase